MIEAIGQYEVRVTHHKKELELTKDSRRTMKWNGKRMDAPLCRMDGPIGKEEIW